ncbi:MAG: hypothetical protein ACPGSM_18480 [Thiolinea sp.]
MLSFAFPHTVDSPHSLAMKDPLDVGLLSLRVTGTRIHTITVWHLLLPASQTRTTIGLPHGQLSSRSWGDTGFPRSAKTSVLG